MRLLIVTQAVDLDDPLLGFFHRWVEEFAKRCERVEVICLKEGEHGLPDNVRVYSLGKEDARAKGRTPVAGKVRYAFRFLHLISRLRRDYDAVFVHMNPEYAALAGWYWRLIGKPVGLWYTHRAVPPGLRIAAPFANVIFTSARESFRVRHRNIVVLGHGIDARRFTAAPKALDRTAPHIVSLGRITPIKHLEIILEAVARLRRAGIAATLELVGGSVSAGDRAYEAKLRAQVKREGIEAAVTFTGFVPPEAIPEVLDRADLSVNACPTGGIDKAVLESLAAGVAAFVSNEAFASFYGDAFAHFHFRQEDAEDLALRIEGYLKSTEDPQVVAGLRESVRAKADIPALVSTIVERLSAALVKSGA